MEIYSNIGDKRNHFASSVEINNPIEFDQKFEELLELAASTKLHAVFRGVPEAKYKLYTSLQRELFNLNLNEAGLGKKMTIQLLANAKEPSRKWANYFKSMGVAENDWLYLALLQHYGAPSPLLDFSKNPKVALYFMCKGLQSRHSTEEIDHYASLVYYKNVEVCKDVAHSLKKTAEEVYKGKVPKPSTRDEIQALIKDDLSFENVMRDQDIEIITAYKGITHITINKKKSVFTLPVTNMNMVSQEGEFVCNVSDDKPMEDLFQKDGRRYLYCLNIHKSLYNYIVSKYFKGSMELQSREFFPSDRELAEDVRMKTLEQLWN